ncbi:MAG TPA: RsmB/NOP family class I SAM-dependent RNA methyltransferase [Candidatus Aenigmarchaeota archaeon]|nr:MAG: tRNA methyltransferase [Candidatus Aenigmarchaeota archaeon]HDD46505.1 RsmB/NOP family class I SAM-dependent RNA methyltransferase [Candidatus Aenigmarchaeota archaeon]
MKQPILPGKFKARYASLLGEENKIFLKYCKMPLRKSIRINTIKANAKEVVSALKDKGWELERVPWFKYGYWVKNADKVAIGNSLEYFLGYIYPQEAASMLPPIILNPKQEDFVLDMAAAPGSKTTQLAQMMDNKGCIVANDKDTSRIKALRFNLDVCGVVNTIVSRMDGIWFKELKERFDLVLLDAPCSGEGVIRKSWNVLSRWSVNMINNLAGLQKGLIGAAIETLKPGGVLVYSTCTLAPEENEGVIDFALKKFDNIKVEKVSVEGLKWRNGIEEWEGKSFNSEVKKTMRIWPQDNDTQAFFIAKVRKL